MDKFRERKKGFFEVLFFLPNCHASSGRLDGRWKEGFIQRRYIQFTTIERTITVHNVPWWRQSSPPTQSPWRCVPVWTQKFGNIKVKTRRSMFLSLNWIYLWKNSLQNSMEVTGLQWKFFFIMLEYLSGKMLNVFSRTHWMSAIQKKVQSWPRTKVPQAFQRRESFLALSFESSVKISQSWMRAVN